MLRMEQLEKGKGIEIAGIFVPEETVQKSKVFCEDDAEESVYKDAERSLKADMESLIAEQYPEYVDDQHYEQAIIDEMFEKSGMVAHEMFEECNMIARKKRACFRVLDDPRDRDAAMSLYRAVSSALAGMLYDKLELADDEETYEDD